MLGATNRTNQRPKATDIHQLIEVAEVIVHPEYRPGRAYADLAVVKLTASYDLREFLPVCLNTVADVPLRTGLRATAAGWNIVGTWLDLTSTVVSTQTQ
ncbi:hypothetical protein FOCC_FOCC017694 [Frankliniella occidentalis]|nr:hypothetical protein FOCC_FOCC017694 [Frankliniella occidentalis]